MSDPTVDYLRYPTLCRIDPGPEKQLSTFRFRHYPEESAPFYLAGPCRKTEKKAPGASEGEKPSGESGTPEEDTSYRIRCRSDGPASFYRTGFQKKVQPSSEDRQPPRKDGGGHLLSDPLPF